MGKNSPDGWSSGFLAERLNILQFSTADDGGGAEKLACNLFQKYRSRGHHSWLAVGNKHGNDPDVFLLPNDTCRNQWARSWISIANIFSPMMGKVWGAKQLRYWLPWIGQPRRILEILQGQEDFDFPATQQILNLFPEQPDIIHCHNLHGGYFDLRFLSRLSHQIPVILSLHDAWLLSGHCAHSFDCERWKTGCGECPDLAIYPAVPRDATNYNWQRKKEIYSQSRLYVTTACQWLMRKVEESILASGVVESRIIPYGVDPSIFHPDNRRMVRSMLSIPQEYKVLLFVGHGVRKNIWKDYRAMKAAMDQVARHLEGEKILFIALGEEAPEEKMGQIVIRFVPSRQSREDLARYYQAADIYIHAARVDTFPMVILEALACGTPVIATAVGGIPEQVKSLGRDYGIQEATGMLVPPFDAEEMARAIELLLCDDVLRLQLGKNAAEDAKKRFDLNRQVDDYLSWYQELIRTSCESSRQ